MEDIQEIYYFPIDAEGNEVGEPIRIGLNDDGSADLSKLPEKLRKTYERFGSGDSLLGPILPKKGSAFLNALLQSAGPYNRFRSRAT